jgi:uridine phosphorylase
MHSPTAAVSTSSDEKALEFDQPMSPFTPQFKKRGSLVDTKNCNLDHMADDCLYHLGLSKETDASKFADVKYVCIGGTNDRMTKFAYQVAKTLNMKSSDVQSVGLHKRYVIYLVGPVLVCSHGMGGPSISILLNEVAKLLKYAQADAYWIRMGTCGGLDVAPGGLIISSESLNGALEPYHQTIVLGKRVQRPAVFDDQLTSDLLDVAKVLKLDSVIGKTMCCDDFYEG